MLPTAVEIVSTVKRKLRGHPGIKAAYLVGSYATGNASEKSDIDLALVLDMDRLSGYGELANIADELEIELHKSVHLLLEEHIYDRKIPILD